MQTIFRSKGFSYQFRHLISIEHSRILKNNTKCLQDYSFNSPPKYSRTMLHMPWRLSILISTFVRSTIISYRTLNYYLYSLKHLYRYSYHISRLCYVKQLDFVWWSWFTCTKLSEHHNWWNACLSKRLKVFKWNDYGVFPVSSLLN